MHSFIQSLTVMLPTAAAPASSPARPLEWQRPHSATPASVIEILSDGEEEQQQRQAVRGECTSIQVDGGVRVVFRVRSRDVAYKSSGNSVERFGPDGVFRFGERSPSPHASSRSTRRPPPALGALYPPPAHSMSNAWTTTPFPWRLRSITALNGAEIVFQFDGDAKRIFGDVTPPDDTLSIMALGRGRISGLRCEDSMRVRAECTDIDSRIAWKGGFRVREATLRAGNEGTIQGVVARERLCMVQMDGRGQFKSIGVLNTAQPVEIEFLPESHRHPRALVPHYEIQPQPNEQDESTSFFADMLTDMLTSIGGADRSEGDEDETGAEHSGALRRSSGAFPQEHIRRAERESIEALERFEERRREASAEKFKRKLDEPGFVKFSNKSRRCEPARARPTPRRACARSSSSVFTEEPTRGEVNTPATTGSSGAAASTAPGNCSICFEPLTGAAALMDGCNHVCACFSCGINAYTQCGGRCPVCKSEVTGITEIFLALAPPAGTSATTPIKS